MSGQPLQRMTADEFLAWAEGQPGRWELHHGVPVAMAPERIGHGKVRFAVQTALAAAITTAGLPCHMLPDSVAVRISATVTFEPDALVYCGAELPASTLEINEPMIIVEVASPSTRRIDSTLKLAGYFSVPSVEHYLIVDPERLPVIHHQRQPDGTILTRLVTEGHIRLDPPGLEVPIAALGIGP